MGDSKNLLLIFTRNPELGKCKTRLAATIGDAAALEVYKFLLAHTKNISQNLPVHKTVYYSEEIWEKDLWDRAVYSKEIQQGADLGARMEAAFEKGFASGFDKIVVIGSDLFDLNSKELEEAFNLLKTHKYVIGPATDGGYYLLGMKAVNKALFKNKPWGTSTVLEKTLLDLEQEDVALLPYKNDVDVYDDIKDNEAFKPFLKEYRP